MRRSKLDNTLTWIFMFLAVAAVICYFAFTGKKPFFICGGAAICLRLSQYIMRFMN